jgi:hypothetical protein
MRILETGQRVLGGEQVEIGTAYEDEIRDYARLRKIRHRKNRSRLFGLRDAFPSRSPNKRQVFQSSVQHGLRLSPKSYCFLPCKFKIYIVK